VHGRTKGWEYSTQFIRSQELWNIRTKMVSCESGQVGDITCFRTGTASQWVEHDFSINSLGLTFSQLFEKWN
jgi:hypothetical protein